MPKLTDKQEMFCHEYLVDFNARQAAIRAGYQGMSAHVSGSRNLSNEAVSARLKELIQKRKARVDASADYVLQRLIAIDKLDVADILDDEGNILPIRQWSDAWRLSVSAIDVSEVKSANALIKKIRMPDKLKNLELIGKHTDVSAFKDKMELAGTDGRELVVNVTTAQARKNVKALEAWLRAGEEE